MDVQGKVVLITGASAGIGLAAARRFRRDSAVTRNPGESAEQHPLLDPCITLKYKQE